jgi:hypothetical protein
MFRVLKRKRVVVSLGVVASLALTAAAIAYFTSTGSGTGQATVGTSTAWSVTFGTTTGTMYPGSGTSNVPYTVTNPSSGHQYLASTSATVKDDGSGNITDGGSSVAGCSSSWFTATNHSPAAVDLAGAGTTTGSVDVTLANVGSSQDPCKGHHPDIVVDAS